MEYGFSFPTPQATVDRAKAENEKLIERKRRILTELSAIENGINLYDILNPARDALSSSVTDAPCSVEMLTHKKVYKPKKLNIKNASDSIADIIMKIGQNPSKVPAFHIREPHPCTEVVNNANVFFAQLHFMRSSRASLLSSLAIINHSNNMQPPGNTPNPNQKIVEDQTNPPITPKKSHPFFPEIRGIHPLLGHMKKQLGEFPTFIRNPPDDAECEDLVMSAPPDCFQKHIFEICGSSSDDDFDPDSLKL
ncbi:hypothetical protein GPJ56_004417 [Histomonas meleagridis]|uniref:uncharacterized protein n=1 Tax=Histomonas meleagridis TaxID=135588 RepID=UPI00355A5518|nr:hypothetical protein GPJ56_004417 [Histomonas meleagridis]KAH0799938.1 hypothetical protein GO595_007050 [Histomonas meleagridis]